MNDVKQVLETLVLEFIKDYEAWNNFAAQHIGSTDKAISETIHAKYQALIDTYCLPNKQFQGLAYGGDSSHQAAKETIETIKLDDNDPNKIIVETNMPDSLGYPDCYSYHFVLKNEKWYLDEIYYCGYPSL